MWVKLFLFTVGLFITLDETDISYLHPNSPDNPQDHPYGPDFPPGPGPSQDHPTPSPPHPVPVTDDTPSQNEPTPTPPHPVPVTDDTPSPNPPTPSNPSTPTNAEEIEDPNALKVHLMVTPHTDAGWIYTFEEYYQGKTGNDGGCVKCILDNVMESFKNNPNRKFDMSEMAYFNRWWADQNATSKAAFKEAIKDKQFGFMNGAWVANDEATAYYDDIMENFILGHRWLKDNLGIDANVGWQVDSFGNSASHAGLMAQAGYDAMFFSRADYIDREKRIHEKSLQFNWAPPNPYNESVFTQMLPLEYADARFIVPSGSPCRSIFCGGGLNQDGYNKIERFLKDHATYYSTKNVLFLVCDDFLFTHGSEVYFQGAEAMIKYFNDHPEKGIKVKFSHLSDYVAAVKKDVLAENLASKIPYKHDDTFPYIEQRGHVWTGYFTSKPMYKMLVRQFSGYYNAAKLFLTKLLILNNKNILDATSDQEKVNKALNSLEQTLSIIQHHDSVTGTMKNYVKEDYEKMIAKARSDAEAVIQPVMVKYLNEKISETVTPANVNYDWRYQDGAYDNIFHAGQTPTFSVFNPGHARKLLITVKVPNTSYTVLDESNEEIISDVICHSNDMTKDCFLYFANSFGPYSTKAYKVVPSEGRDKLQSTPCTEDENVIVDMTNFTLKVAHNLLDFDYKYCVTQDNCTKDSFKLDYYYYPSSAGWGGKPPSGAYIFNPNSQQKMAYSQVLSGRVYKGKVVTLLQIFRNNSRTDIKIVHHQLEKGLEVNSYLDPVKDVGTEIVMGVKSNSIDNGNTIFYTDSNGYFMEKRVKDHKDDYSISVQEGLAINYYPMTSNMYIQDESSTQRLSLVTDRAQGASSLNPGELEVMLHRVTRADDWKGVGEILQEKDANGHLISVVTRHYISYSQPSIGIKDQRRQQQYDFDRAPFLWFFVSSSDKFKSTQNFEGDGLVLENLVKFFVRSYQPNEYIVRLNNLDDVDPKKVEIYDPTTKECTILSKFAGITGYQVDSVTELSWMTTKDKSQVSRNVLDPNSIDPMTEHDKDYSTIYLVPMEIRTFSIKVKTA